MMNIEEHNMKWTAEQQTLFDERCPEFIEGLRARKLAGTLKTEEQSRGKEKHSSLSPWADANQH
jgi:exonuclease I